MVLIFSSCESQMGTAVRTAFRNVVSGDAFVSSSGDAAYKSLKDNYLQKPVNISLSTTCTQVDTLGPILGIDTQDLSAIKDNLCSCEAWGTCDSKSCRCETLCPKNFGIFKKVDPYGFDSEENTLAFSNGDNKFVSESSYKGYCWGISLITQKFNRLATFSSQPKKFEGLDLETNRLKEYKNIIARINNNEPVTIPGFQSLYDFSSDPEVKNLLEDSAKEEWAKNAMTTQGLGMISSVATPEKKEMESMFDDLEFRLKNNMSPAIVYNTKKSRADAHVLLVSGVGKDPNTNERHLCLRDNNYQADMSMDCKIRMVLKADGRVIRQRVYPNDAQWMIETEEVGKVALTHSENPSVVEQVNNLHAKCIGEKNCSKI